MARRGCARLCLSHFETPDEVAQFSDGERLISLQAIECRLRDRMSAFGICSSALPGAELNGKNLLQGGHPCTTTSHLANLREAQTRGFQ
jgi:hypothetical protein